MVLEKLQKLGLSQKEASLYKALFELGNTVVTDLAERADVNRSTAYVLIDSLSKKGLVSVSEKRGIKVFSPVSPDKLVDIAEQRFTEAGEILKIGKEVVSELSKISKIDNDDSQIRVNVFDGKEGIKTTANLVRQGKDFEYIVTASSTKPDQTEIGSIPLKNKQVLTLDDKDQCMLAISDGEVAFISPTSDSSFVIKSKHFASAIKGMFDMASNKSANSKNDKAQVKSQTKEVQKKVKTLVTAEKRFWDEK